MKLKPYPEYKNTNLPWIDNLPRNWKLTRAKNLFKQIDIRSDTGEEELLSVSEKHGVTPRNNVNVTMFKAESYKGYKLCWPGDLVINSLWAWMQGLGFSKYFGIVSTAYGVYRIKDKYIVSDKYLNYLFRAEAYRWELRVRSKGIWRSRYQLTDDSFLTMPVIIPPKEEQEQIVKFLNYKNEQIAKFIRDKKRMIQLLKEQKQAIINQAVTKGINPIVKMKPSGIEWIGDIPEHWETRRLRTIATVKLSGVDKHIKEEEIPVKLCNYVDVYNNDQIVSSIEFMKATATVSEIDNYKIKEGDVLITKDSEMWEDIAVPSFVPRELPGIICGYHLAIVRPLNIYGEFLFYTFCSNSISNQFKISANGVTRYGLSQGAIKNAWFPLPPILEQRKIVIYIRQNISKIDFVIRKTQKEIKIIQEYRTRLISDVVTGKIDVRGIEVEDIPGEELTEELETTEESEVPEENSQEVSNAS